MLNVVKCQGYEYLKWKKELPHPKVMPTSAIELANSVVENVISQWSQGSGSRKGVKYMYTVYSNESCVIVGK